MPVAYTRFMLMPSGFFAQNPALDVPAPTPEAQQQWPQLPLGTAWSRDFGQTWVILCVTMSLDVVTLVSAFSSEVDQ